MTYRSAHRIKEVTWQTPFFNWVKCNIDGASNGNPGPSSCGGTFKNNDADFLGAFALNMGISTSLCAELHSAIIAIEIAFNRGWNHLWLETDSMLVTLAFKSKSVVPWQLRNIWENCLHLTSSISFFITHIYREGNHCVDKLASISLALNTFFWWDHIPSQLEMDFARNRLCLPYFRFVNLFWGLGCMSPLSFVSCSLFL